MLRDDRQTALNGAIEACLHAAHVHDDGAELIGDDPAGLRHLAARRRRDAKTLVGHLRRLGDLPKEPDPEYEMAADFVSHIQAALSDEERGHVLARSRQAEEAVAEALRAVLNEDVASDCRTDVEQILSAVTRCLP